MSRRYAQLRRRMQAQLAAALLLLAAVFAALWAVSLAGQWQVTRDLRPLDFNDYPAHAARTTVYVERGRLTLSHWSSRTPVYGEPVRVTWEAGPKDRRLYLPLDWSHGVMQIKWMWRTSQVQMPPELGAPPAVYKARVLAVPLWPLILLCGVGGWLLGRRNWRERRRVRNGQCPACGYDIRATPQRCPECGLGEVGIVQN